MSRKIKKETILNDIAEKIKSCEQYQNINPDPTAKNRIEMMENDPCNNSTYYVNLTLKNSISEKNTNLSDRIKYIENKRYLPLQKELDDAYENGCIITIDVEHLSINISNFSSFSDLIKELISYYLNNSYILYRFNPKSPQTDTFGDSYVGDDIKAAREAGKKCIIYSIARFNKKSIENFLKQQFDDEKYDLYSYDIQNFEEVGYVDMTRSTSFEQNVNSSIGGSILNDVTMFNLKKKLPDYNIKKEHGVYDMVAYINGILGEIKSSDASQARKKYEIYSKGIFKDYETAKYDTYKSNGGTTDWATWNDAQGQYLTFKAASSYDSDLANEGINNSTYQSNLHAFEIASDFFLNSKMECMNLSWKKDGDVFKRKPIVEISFSGKPSSVGKANAESLVNSNMIDPPSIVVKPYNSNIEFNDDILYNFSVTVPRDPNDKEFSGKATNLVSDPSGAYERINGFYKSNNIIPIKRDIIKLNSIEYEYTNVKIDIDPNDVPYTDDLTQKHDYYTIPEKYYYNSSNRLMFDSNKLSDKLTQAAIIYNIIPKSITVPIKFIQHSSWKNIEPAEEAIKKLEEEYNNVNGKEYKRLCIDSIPYDPWEKLISYLEILYAKWSQICTDKDEMIEIPPIEDESIKDNICEICGKTNSNCTCEKMKLCMQNFPINLNGESEEDNKFQSLFNASTYIFNLKDEPLTYAQLAREIYHLLCQKEKTDDISNFISMTPEVEMVLGSTFENLIHSYTFKMDNSILSQLNEDDFNNFKEHYSKTLKTDPVSLLNDKVIKKLPVGLMNGILYIPTGHSILFEYSVENGTLILNGTSETIMNKLAEYAKTSKNDYLETMSMATEIYGDAMIPENVKKFMVFPHIPNIDKILKGEAKDPLSLFSDYEEDFTYVINIFDLNTIKNNKYGLNKISVRFYIYQKKAVICSYPRCKDPIFESKYSDGICGLNEFFRTPIIINASSFLLKNELKKRNIRYMMNELKKYSINLVNNIIKLKISACDIEKNLNIIEDIKLKSLNDLYNFNLEYNQLMQKIPKDELDENAKMSIVCAIAKLSKEKSIINDFDTIFSHIMRSMLLLTDDFYNINEHIFNSTISDLNSCKNGIKEYFSEIAENGKKFNMCLIKFSDFIDDNGNYKEFETGIIDTEKSNIEKKLEKMIISRFINHEIYEKTKKINLKPGDILELAKMISKGNIAGVKAFVEDHKKLIENSNCDEKIKDITKIEENIEVLHEFTKLEDSSKNIVNKIIEMAKKFLNPESIIKTPEQMNFDKYQDFNEMTENIMTSIESANSDEILNQSSKEVNEKINKNDNSTIPKDIIIEMFQYIGEKTEDYRKITNNFISYE